MSGWVVPGPRLTSTPASVSIHLFGIEGHKKESRVATLRRYEPGYGKRRALSEMRSIFGCQWSNGMLPQIRFVPGALGAGGAYRPGPEDWGVTPAISGATGMRTSGITQPPIVGVCVHEVFVKLSDGEKRGHLEDFLSFSEGVRRFHRWLLSERDPWGEDLALCLHPWETGTDTSPAFDSLIETTRLYAEASGLPVHLFGRADTTHVPAEHRPTDRDYFAYFGLLALFKKHEYQQRPTIEDSPVLLQDVLFNSLLAASLFAHSLLLLRLAEVVGEQGANRHNGRLELEEQAAQAVEMYERVARAIRRKLWDQGR